MTSRPLVDVAMSFVRATAPHVTDGGVHRLLRDSFEQFLAGILPHDYLAGLLQQHIGSVQPLERIDCILQCPEDPPLPSNAGRYRGPESLTSPRRKPCPWSPFEDVRLLAAIHRFGTENWGSVAQFVGNHRTRAQCSQRWVRGLDPRISKDQWSPSEEDHLCGLVRERGTKIWAQIAAEIGNRSDVQCRYHFFQMYRDNRLPRDLHGLVAAEKPPAMPVAQARPTPVIITCERARANSIGPRLPVMPGYRRQIGIQDAGGMAVRTPRRLSLPAISERKHDSDGEMGAPEQSVDSDIVDWSFTAVDEGEVTRWW
jgi:hypothetical protein